jgi:hypothetical protein
VTATSLPAALDVLRDLCLDVVAVVLLASGVQKALGLSAFRRGLLFLPYMRVSWSYLVGYTLPFLEIALAVGLFAGWRPAATGAMLLFAAFAVVAAVSLRKRLSVPCNCFGAGGGRTLSPATIGLNLALIALAAVGTPAPSRPWEAISIVVAASLVLLVPTLTAAAEMLAAARRVQGLERS